MSSYVKLYLIIEQKSFNFTYIFYSISSIYILVLYLYNDESNK